MDDSSTKDGSGADLIIENPNEEWHEHALKFIFKASNNEVEYKALIAGVKLCYTVGADSVQRSLTPNWGLASSTEHTKLRMTPWRHMFGGYDKPLSC